MFIGRMVMGGVVVVGVNGRHVRSCKSLCKLTGSSVVSDILPVWFSRVDIEAGMELKDCCSCKC